MFVLQSVWQFISWAFFGLLSIILGFFGLFIPPFQLVGLSCVLAIALTLAFFACGRRLRDRDDIVVAMCCVLITAFVWNTTSWLTRAARVSFASNRDVVVERVTELTANVNEARSGMATAHAALTKVVSKASMGRQDADSPGSATAPDASPATLIETVDGLIEEGEVAIELHQKLIDAIQAYSGLLPAAQQACLQAAEHQRELGEAEPYSELKETYLAASRYFERYATTIANSEQAILQPETAVEENARYVEHAIQFLRRFRDDLQTIPEFPGPEMHAEVIRAMQTFVRDFERFRTALDTFGHAMPSDLPPVTVPDARTGEDRTA